MDAPRFVDRPVFDGAAGCAHPRQRLAQIIDLDRKMGNHRSRSTRLRDAELNRHLRLVAIGDDPAQIHDGFETEYILVEPLRLGDISACAAHVG